MSAKQLPASWLNADRHFVHDVFVRRPLTSWHQLNSGAALTYILPVFANFESDLPCGHAHYSTRPTYMELRTAFALFCDLGSRTHAAQMRELSSCVDSNLIEVDDFPHLDQFYIFTLMLVPPCQWNFKTRSLKVLIATLDKRVFPIKWYKVFSAKSTHTSKFPLYKRIFKLTWAKWKE